MGERGIIAQALQRAAIIREYNNALADGHTALAEAIRVNPDNRDIFEYVSPGEYVSLNGK